LLAQVHLPQAQKKIWTMIANDNIRLVDLNTSTGASKWERLDFAITNSSSEPYDWYIDRAAVDLILQAKSLDPDALKVELVLTGDPYGYLSSEDDQQAITIRTHDYLEYGYTEVLGCDQVENANV
jgi:hypothetical protein